jgi:O-antigen/teichoic acid export membrane protein
VPAVEQVTDATLGGRFEGAARESLRTRTARGTIVNGAFLVGTMGLGVFQATVVARLLPPSVIGRFELLMAVFMTILTLGGVGVDDKYIQQNDADQQRAFEIAFTLQWLVAAALAVLLLIGLPVFAALYGQPAIILPGIALVASLPALVLQMPLWAHYRRMDFVRQRALQLLNAVVMFAAVLALVLAGLELWALVLAGLIASWVSAAVTVRSSPYALRLRWERGKLREYSSFSWPLFVGTITAVIQWQVPLTVSARLFGVTAVAGIALSLNIAQFTTRVDDILTVTLYPAICAVKDRADLLYESFWKSNRLAMLWAAPRGWGAAQFIGGFVHFVIGEKWRFAAPLIGITGASAAINQIGFNWTAYFRAVGATRPVAVNNSVALATMLVVGVPLLVVDGVTGFGIGIGIVTLVTVSVRVRYLLRLFPRLAIFGHILRGIGPALAATAAIVLLRVASGGARSVPSVAIEAALFTVITVGVTLASERRLLAEAANYLRRRAAATATP